MVLRRDAQVRSQQRLNPGLGASDFLVIGGGIIGRAVALALARAGRSVDVVDEPDKPFGSATTAAGAMLGAYGEVTGDDSQTATRVEAALGYADFLAVVDELADEPESLLRRGTFVVASGRVPTDLPNLRAIVSAVEADRARWEDVEPRDVPGFTPSPDWPCARVVHLPDEAWLDPGRLLDRLQRALAATGRGRSVSARVERLVVEGDRVLGAEVTGGSRVLAATTVLCAGAATGGLLPPQFATALPAIAWAKGTAVVLRPVGAPLPHVIRTPNRQFACGLHAVPLAGSDVYVGATNRASTVPGVTGGATAAEVQVLLHGAMHQLQRRWDRADLVGLRHGNRPLPADGRPIAGATEVPGLAVVTGTYRNGVLLAPLLADLVAAELVGETQPRAANPFSPVGRSADLTAQPPWVQARARRGAEDMITTLLEPDGHVPFGRSADLAGLLALLLERVMVEEGWPAAGADLGRAVQALHRDELVPEVFQLLLRGTGILED